VLGRLVVDAKGLVAAMRIGAGATDMTMLLMIVVAVLGV